MTDTDRYARQRLISWWDQERLRAARVVVAGAGALGNEVLKNLALLGVGHLLVIDSDCVEFSNLSRTVLFQQADVGRPKVEVAGAALARINPEVCVRTIWGDLSDDVGLGHYRHSQLAIGCLDNLAARVQVGLCCALAGIPYLDGGMWSLGGEVRWFSAGAGPCFACTLNDEQWTHLRERRSCTGFQNPAALGNGHVATVATTAAIIGGLLAQEAAKWLCGQPVVTGRALVFNGLALQMHRAELPRNPQCSSSHFPHPQVIELPCRAADLTAGELLARARADAARLSLEADDLVLELGRDLLVAFHCDACGQNDEILRSQGQVPESEQRCPRCGVARPAEVVCSLDGTSPLADRTLAALRIPPAEIVAVRTAKELLLYELTADIDLVR